MTAPNRPLLRTRPAWSHSAFPGRLWVGKVGAILEASCCGPHR